MLHGYKNPVKMQDGTMLPSIQQMIKGYTIIDPPTKQEAAIPPSMLREAYKTAKSP